MRLLLLFISAASAVFGGEFDDLLQDRRAIEEVYHHHRLNTQRTFEEAMPMETVKMLVQRDLHKEAVLKRAYGVTITQPMMRAEMQRIDQTTRAPEILAEVKAALGNDAERFARVYVKPIIVERELHRRFQFDDAVHTPKRREAEQAREQLKAGNEVEGMHEVTWQMTPRPQDDPPAQAAPPSVPKEVKGKSRSYSIEGTVNRAQVLGGGAGVEGESEKRFYFEDLNPKLQKVIQAQLRQADDVSAVIEVPHGFTVYQAMERTAEQLTVRVLSIPKIAYDQWLKNQATVKR